MSYIITDDKHYKSIANSIRSKMQTDRKYYPEDMAAAIDNIPSSSDGTNEPIGGIYFLNPNDNGYITKIKISGFKLDNKETVFPLVFNDKIFIYIEDVEFINCDFKHLSSYVFQNCASLKSINLPSSLTSINDHTFSGCTSLSTINLPSSLTSIGNVIFAGCENLEFVTLGNGFNANGLNLFSSTLYTRETILQWLNALADRTGQTAYKLTIGAKNLAKLTEQDILIATDKNWTLA